MKRSAASAARAAGMAGVAPLILTLALALGACAGMGIHNPSVKGEATLARPAHIYIRPFDPGDEWEGDFTRRTKEQAIREEMLLLNEHLAAQLGQIAPTSYLSVSDPFPATGLLITGRLNRVNMGSGAARYHLGVLGVGGREIDGNVEIFDLNLSSDKPVLTFGLRGEARGEGGLLGGPETLSAEWARIARDIRILILKRLGP